MKKRRFIVWFLILFGICLVFVTVRQVDIMRDERIHAAQTLHNTLESTWANVAPLPTAARQASAVFHTEATVALLDTKGNILAETAEFLVLRDAKEVQIALLPELSDQQRAHLITAASDDPEVTAERLAHASAIQYDLYPYGDTVYLRSTFFNAREARSVSVPIQLWTQGEGALLRASLTDNGGTPLETNAWVPYLRSEPADTARLQALLNGAKPKHSFFTREYLERIPAPEDLEAAQVAVYRADHPLADFFQNQGWDLMIGVLFSAVAAAALALLLSKLGRRRNAAE